MTQEKKRSQAQEVWARLKTNKIAVLSMFIILLLVLIALTANLFLDYDVDAIKQNISNARQSPSAEHWFGTDEYGRDVFARVIFGTRISLAIGVVCVIVSMLVGIVLGAVSGYYGGLIDNIIMRIVDVFMAIPSTLLVIAIVAVLGSTVTNLIIAISIAYFPGYARIVRASVLTVKGNEYVEAAVALGGRARHIIFKHLVMNSLAPIIVQGTLGISSIIVAAAALSYMGLGAQAPMPEWGAMLSASREFMQTEPYLMFFPGLFIFITSLAFSLLGDGLRDALDPKLKN